MKHERFPEVRLNGHRFNFDPYDEPSNEELGITPYPKWVRVLFWFGCFFAGLSAWIALAKWAISA